MILGGWLVVSVAGGGLASEVGRAGEGNLLNVDTRPLSERHRRTVDPARRLRLAEDGVAAADIVIPETCSPVVVFAAQELKRHLDRATGGDFAIR